MKYCFIVNPYAGKGKHTEELCQNIKDTLGKRNVDFEICITDKIGDARDYIRKTVEERKDNEEIGFFGCGGDGTLCETVNGVMCLENREKVYVGLVPIGTGNDFVRNFGTGAEFMDIAAQEECKPYFVDLIRCNDMYAINMVNIGFDCEVVCKTAHFKRKPYIPSKFAYIAGLIATLVKKPGVKAKMSIDGGEKTEESLLLTTFANGSFCGGGFHSNPLAGLDDGKIDALLIKNMSRIKFISLVGDYKGGTHLSKEKFKKILTHKKAYEIELEFGEDANICIDGEVIRADRLHMSVEKKALGFLVPKGAAVGLCDASPEKEEARI